MIYAQVEYNPLILHKIMAYPMPRLWHMHTIRWLVTAEF